MIKNLSLNQSCPNFASKKAVRNTTFTGPHFWPKGEGGGCSVKNRVYINRIEAEARRRAHPSALHNLLDKTLKLLRLR